MLFHRRVKGCNYKKNSTSTDKNTLLLGATSYTGCNCSCAYGKYYRVQFLTHVIIVTVKIRSVCAGVKQNILRNVLYSTTNNILVFLEFIDNSFKCYLLQYDMKYQRPG